MPQSLLYKTLRHTSASAPRRDPRPLGSRLPRENLPNQFPRDKTKNSLATPMKLEGTRGPEIWHATARRNGRDPKFATQEWGSYRLQNDVTPVCGSPRFGGHVVFNVFLIVTPIPGPQLPRQKWGSPKICTTPPGGVPGVVPCWSAVAPVHGAWPQNWGQA